jgi:hypothetical protein
MNQKNLAKIAVDIKQASRQLALDAQRVSEAKKHCEATAALVAELTKKNTALTGRKRAC